MWPISRRDLGPDGYDVRLNRGQTALLASASAVAAALAIFGAPGELPGSPAAAYGRTTSCAGAISWREARSAVGHTATVRGRVAGTHFAASSNGQPTFLNLGVDYPDARRFTVVIFGADRDAFGQPEVRYRGRTICARGTVRSYRGGPEMIAHSPSQIAVVG